MRDTVANHRGGRPPSSDPEDGPVAKVTMPQLGESVAEGTIGKWLKQPGDHVAKYEPLLEVITDKVNAEVPSPYEGTLTQILAEEGATVLNNAEIAIIEAVGEGGSAAAAEAAPAISASASAGAPAAAPPAPAAAPPAPAAEAQAAAERPAEPPAALTPAPVAAAVPSASVNGAGDPGDPDARMTPAVRRLLREHDLSPAQIAGTGHAGRITRDDVIAFVEAQRTGQPGAAAPAMAAPTSAVAAAPAAAPSPPPAAAASAPPAPRSAPAAAAAPVAFDAGIDEKLIPWTQMRKGVANAMIRSKTSVPHAYTMVEVDVTNIVALRSANKAAYQAREGISLSYVPFVIKAVVEALRKHPTLNAHWTEDGLLVKRHVGVAVAVAVDNGLITPVIQAAETLSINGLNHAVIDLANRARANKLRLDDLNGGTITVNNTGWFGSIASQSIVNTPQVVIVNLEAIVKRPVVRETPDGDVIAVRSIMNLPAAFDHRATDGAQVGLFVADIKSWLESIGPDTAIF